MTNLETLKSYLEIRGFDTVYEEGAFGAPILAASIVTNAGSMSVLAGARSARIVKPNGSVKWYYEKSNAQICRVIDQVLEFANA